jgi:hypothetical protein
LTWKLKGTPFNRSYFQLQVSALAHTEETASGLLPTVKTWDNTKQRPLDENGENRSQTTGTKYGVHLTQMAEAGMLPTPTAFDYNTPRSQEAWDKAKEKHGDALQNPLKQMAAFGMLPTPQANCSKGMNPENVELRGNKIYNKKTGQQIQSSPEQWAKMGMLPTPVASDHHNRWPTENWKGESDLPSVVNGQLGTGSQLSPLFVEEMMGFPKNWTASPFQSGDENP